MRRYKGIFIYSFAKKGKQKGQRRAFKKKKKKENSIACRGLGRVVGPLLAARALPLRCAASTMLSSALLAI
jgi:hypothetical protein